MRRWLGVALAVSLLGVAACRGERAAEEEAAPDTAQVTPAPAPAAAPAETVPPETVPPTDTMGAMQDTTGQSM